MKKVLLIAAVAALFCLTSCENKDELRCWKVTVKTQTLGVDVSATGYVWDSQNHLEVYKQEQESAAKVAGVTYEMNYEKASKYKNQVDCEAQNADNADFLWP